MNQRASRLCMRLLTAAAAAIFFLAAFGGKSTFAQDVYDFDIARADLVTVVTAIARTSGTAVSFPAGLAQGRMAGPIHMRGSAQAVLGSALVGSGLEAVPLAGGGLTIRAVTEAGTDGATVEGDVEAIDVTDVSGGQNNDQGFMAGNAGGTVRIADAPIKEIPISVSAVTEDVIESQSLTTAAEAVRNVAGVTVLDSGSTGRPVFQVRGFDAGDGGYTVNGQQAFDSISAPIDSVERVEVLKGPTSILTGVSANGGLVNVVLKAPTEETIREVTTRYGSNSKKSLALDMGGIVPGTEDFTYRFVTSGLHANETESGYADPYEFLFFPSVKWTGEDLTVSASLNYTRQRLVKSAAQVYLLESFDPISNEPIRELLQPPEGLALGNRDFNDAAEALTLNTEQSYDAGTILGGIEVKFDNTFEYTRGSIDSRAIRVAPSAAGPTTFDYMTSYSERDSDILTVRPSTTLTYEGSSAKSTLKVGYDYQRTITDTGSADGTMGTFDIGAGGSTVPIFEGSPTILEDSEYVSKGFYAIEKLDLLDNRLHLLGSIRYDWYRNTLTTDNVLISDAPNKGPSYVLGAAWDVTDELTAYVNHSDGFSPMGTYEGRPIPPEGRTLYEAGLRLSMFDDRFSVTTSVYDLTQTNMTLFDFSTLPVTFIPTAGQRSRGIEVEAQGELLPGWNIIASATALDAVSLDEEAYIDPTAGNPKYQGSIWTTYTLQEDTVLPGLTFGIGARAVSKSEVNVSSDGSVFNVGGYTVASAMVGYERGNFSADLKINNLFDKVALQPTRSTDQLLLDPRRNWLLTARYKF